MLVPAGERDNLIRATLLLETRQMLSHPRHRSHKPKKRPTTTKNNCKMYFSSTSFLSLLVTVGAVAASVRGGSTTGARSLSQVTLANSNGSNEEVCFQGFVNTAEEQLTELLINQLLGKSTSDHASKFSSFPKVTQTVSGVPDYLVGCSIFDFKCMECSLCKDVYETLVETGSEAACDAACIVVVEAAGGGPEDRKSHTCRRLSVKRVRPLDSRDYSRITHPLDTHLCDSLFLCFCCLCLSQPLRTW